MSAGNHEAKMEEDGRRRREKELEKRCIVTDEEADKEREKRIYFYE